MEIKISAQRSNLKYTKTDSTVGSFKTATTERYVPLYNLITRTIAKNKSNNKKEYILNEQIT